MVLRHCSRRTFLRSSGIFSSALIASRRTTRAAKLRISKAQRVKEVLHGEKADRPPFTYWHHFRLEKFPGEKHAETTLAFYRKFDVDLLKVMSDFPYPVPQGLDKITEEADWQRLEVLKNPFPEQIKALNIIHKELKGEALFVETIFQSWTVARKLSSRAALAKLKDENPDLLKRMLRTISQSQANHVRQALDAGAAGIFLAVEAANDDIMDAEEYQKLVRESDLIVLDAAQNGGHLNILHMHGNKIHFDLLVSYPVQIINYSVHGTGIDLNVAKTKFSGTIMGGLDENRIAKVPRDELKSQIEAAARVMQNRRFILSPGCSVPDDIPDEPLLQVKEIVQNG